MVREKIDLCIHDLSKDFGQVKSHKVKYLDKYGFASVYFKVTKGVNFLFIPAIIIPDEEEDKEDYSRFIDFLKETGLDSWFISSEGVLDDKSLVSILKFIEYERFKLSGKKALHLDLSEFNYKKSVKDVIDDYLIPFNDLKNLRCIYNEENHNLVVLNDEDNEYFDEAREFLGI